MAVSSRQESVGTNAEKLNSAPTDSVSGQTLLIRPVGGIVYVGGASVTSATGFAVNDGEVLTADINPGDDVYGITASGTVTVHVLETSL